MKSYRNDRTYMAQAKAVKRRWKEQGLPCAGCGKLFLWEFEDRKLYPDFWKDPRSFTADHIEAVNVGGRMAPGVAGLQGMCRSCNSSKGDGTKKQRRPPEDPPPLRTSRQW